MGEIKSTNEKKKTQLCFNVGGGVALGGVVLLGGGLAVAGLMAAFSIIKKRNSGKDYSKNEDSSAAAATPSEKKDDGSPGLSFVLQNPSTSVHQNSCCTSHGTAKIGVTESLMDSKELVSAQNMSLGDKTLPIMDGQIEILVSDDLNKEISESCNEIEESSLPAPENMIKNNSSENLRLMDNIEVKKEEEHAETEKMAVEENLLRESVKEEEEEDDDDDDDVSEEHIIEKEEEIAEGDLTPKENLPTQSVAEEGDNDDNNNSEDSVDDDEDVTEEEEESSEGTGSSSMESNVEAIWPTEMIEALSQELREMNANNQNSGEKMIAKPESYDYLHCKNDGSLFNEHASNNETTENSELLNENTHFPTREVVVWSLLAILLLLLLLYSFGSRSFSSEFCRWSTSLNTSQQ